MNTGTKVANLGRISNSLKVTVDGFGNILKAEREHNKTEE
jgi:hypothetical protein